MRLCFAKVLQEGRRMDCLCLQEGTELTDLMFQRLGDVAYEHCLAAAECIAVI